MTQAAAVDTQKQPLTTGDIIALMLETREERRTIAARDKELIEVWRSLEMELLLRLDEQSMTKASTGFGTATITETVLPQVQDWDEFYEHIKETDSFYLLQKRVAAAAYRELQQAGEDVPGISPYPQRSINLRKT